jgi:hypothetical protein
MANALNTTAEEKRQQRSLVLLVPRRHYHFSGSHYINDVVAHQLMWGHYETNP